ncbi:MAG: hypothetical protein CVV30_11705 [Methanomicrobiales archaeon HGW-Methanomicrobiales-1]|jgi:hypothetical protein|nr:MAG: hypothetical protein CVV30_11705 [Methanomicrobiales archaeon HGW-Methanomicrobiales-1]
MNIAEILELEDLRLVEPSFADLTDSRYNALLAQQDTSEGRLLLDEAEEPLALAFQGTNGWIAGTFLCRNPSVALIDLFESVNGEIFQENRAAFAAAVREYFSNAMVAEVPPAIDDLNPARRGILGQLIENTWGSGSGETCVDCCCGSGVGSLVLRDIGYSPLSYDNDASLLSRGLHAGRLLPTETMCLDATIASQYIEPSPKGIGIMLGEFNSFNQDMWEAIVRELFEATKETLITVGTEPEARLVAKWGEDMGRTVEVRENPADPIYDLWVCESHV